MADELAIEPKYSLPRMKSVERISKLPAVEQTVDLANHLYVKVKDTNSLVKTVLNTAETTVKGAVDMTLPVTSKFEGSIKMVDSLLCSSLDFVETKIPAVKLPLDEMYKNTRDSLYTIPGMKCACQAGEQGVKKAVEIAYGASQYGSQKLKDVKDILTQPPQSEGGPGKAKRLKDFGHLKYTLCLHYGLFVADKPHVSDVKGFTDWLGKPPPEKALLTLGKDKTPKKKTTFQITRKASKRTVSRRERWKWNILVVDLDKIQQRRKIRLPNSRQPNQLVT